jgi:hypothetical protein
MIPIEWLNELSEREDGYRDLVAESGSLAIAAWRVAAARCRTFEVATHVPTSAELRAAASVIARRIGLGVVPSGRSLVTDCEARGLLVL